MLTSLRESINYFLYLSIYLIPLFIIATFFVGLIQQYLDDDKVKKKLSGNNKFLNHLLAAIIGAITPFCSCSTIPILLGMINSGVPFGVSMSFLLASPLANYVAFILLGALLGWRIAVIYVLVILIAAVIAGYLLEVLGLESYVKKVMIKNNNEHQNQVAATKNLKDNLNAALSFALGFFKDLFPYLLLGIAIGSLIHGFVPEELILRYAGPDNLLAVPVAAVIGIPIYLSLEAMIPVAFSLFDLGMALGAVMALLMAGSGISIPNIVIISKIFKPRLLTCYIITIFLTASVTGFLFNLI